ncbi:hypothetical protein, partial [Microseira wollei]|uniref:hypothetical protein n=1 Tax=Microseira wollei TaxID=467598 RepID=UPI001CFD488D
GFRKHFQLMGLVDKNDPIFFYRELPQESDRSWLLTGLSPRQVIESTGVGEQLSILMSREKEEF